MPDVDGQPASLLAPARSTAARWCFLVLGWVLLAIAALGVVLPVLPTTPILLLAAPCFARSSPRIHRWLLSNRVFGPLIREWEETRTVPLRAKITAISMIVLFGGISCIFFIDFIWARVAVIACLLGVILWLSRLPSR